MAQEHRVAQLRDLNRAPGEYVSLCLANVLDCPAVRKDGDSLEQCGQLGVRDQYSARLAASGDLHVVVGCRHRGNQL